ncbi:MAG: hypothetical protein Q7K11_00230 [Candidatus Berkelbacteria bacterium]|nr:hypothetical protein [Candidatus Berkelbacteria bacterium]
MVENINGKELGQKRVITLNQKFSPFNLTHLSIPNKWGTLESDSMLAFENLIFPIEIVVVKGPIGKANAVTPFNPEEGHIITDEDFDAEKREKNRKETEYLCLDPVKSPFLLTVDVSNQIPVENFAIAKKIRLRVDAGSGRFEAKPEIGSLELRRLSFGKFYPLDTGPLPAPEHDYTWVGYYLALPDDPKKLAAIEMKFVLAQDSPEEAAAKKADQPL